MVVIAGKEVKQSGSVWDTWLWEALKILLQLAGSNPSGLGYEPPKRAHTGMVFLPLLLLSKLKDSPGCFGSCKRNK